MELNFKPGKTESIVRWMGPGSVGHRRRLEVEHKNLVLCRTALGYEFELRIVPMYKHLGTQTVASASSDTEAFHRAAICASEIRAMRRGILSNAEVSQPRRLLILQAHALSKGLFQAGTWSTLSPRAERRIHSTIMSGYRAVAGECFVEGQPQRADDIVIQELCVMAPVVLMRLQRMLLAVRVAHKAPAYLVMTAFAAKESKRSWINVLQCDLRWASDIYDGLHFARRWDACAWFNHMRAEPGKIKSLLVAACRPPAANRMQSWARSVTQS
eukprot:6030230-Karenia_brevis.AAC.1